MKRSIYSAVILPLALGLTVVSLVAGTVPESVGPIYNGPELDYQPSIIRMLPGGREVAKCNRL